MALESKRQDFSDLQSSFNDFNSKIEQLKTDTKAKLDKIEVLTREQHLVRSHIEMLSRKLALMQCELTQSAQDESIASLKEKAFKNY